MTTKILASARDINERMRDALTHPASNADVMGLNRGFHTALYLACENTYVIDMVNRVWDRIDASRAIISLYVPMRLHTAVDEHDQLLAALTAGSSPAQLEHAARQHNLNAIVAFRADSLPEAAVAASA